MHEQTHGRLADVINHLESGAQLTGELGERKLFHGSILWALGFVVEGGVSDQEAEVSRDGSTISTIDAAGQRHPLFTVYYPPSPRTRRQADGIGSKDLRCRSVECPLDEQHAPRPLRLGDVPEDELVGSTRSLQDIETLVRAGVVLCLATTHGSYEIVGDADGLVFQVWSWGGSIQQERRVYQQSYRTLKALLDGESSRPAFDLPTFVLSA